MSRAGIVFLAACGGAPAPAPAIGHHQTSAWSADVAVFDRGTVRVYSLAGDRVTEVAHVALADHPDDSSLAMVRHGFDWVRRGTKVLGEIPSGDVKFRP